MNLSLPDPVPRNQSASERRWSDAQLRWEVQLAKLAAHGQANIKAAALIRLAPARSVLDLISTATPRDALLIPRMLPALTGNEREELLCGKCSGVIGAGISARTARRRHPEGQRLVIRCPCGALNLLTLHRGLQE